MDSHNHAHDLLMLTLEEPWASLAREELCCHMTWQTFKAASLAMRDAESASDGISIFGSHNYLYHRTFGIIFCRQNKTSFGGRWGEQNKEATAFPSSNSRGWRVMLNG